MFTVSRTPVSETWLSSLPLTPKNRQPLSAQAVIKIKQDRYSISSINTDLFPELLSWSAMTSNQPISPSQSLPSDVSRLGDSDIVMDATLSLSAILDPTTLDFGFDSSCFDGLDDTLVYSPLSAFADTCWSELHSHADHASTSASVPPKRISRRRRTRSPFVASLSSDDSDTESDDCKTFIEEGDIEPILGNGLSSGIQTVGDFTSYDSSPQSLYFSDNFRTSFILFESRLPGPDLKESVGSFPVRPPQHRKTVSGRFAAFRAHLPSSLTFVRPPAH